MARQSRTGEPLGFEDTLSGLPQIGGTRLPRKAMLTWEKGLYAIRRGERPLIRAVGRVSHWTPEWSNSRSR